MAKTKISELDAAAANNTDINSVDVSEGCAPSGINNAIREMGAMLKRMDVGTDALTSPDINGGSIDGATIGTNSVITDLRVDNLKLDANTISSTDTNGNINITPNGTGAVAFTTNVTFGNNDKAVFGNGSDFTIEHNGSKTKLSETGTGNLEVRGTNIDFLDGTGAEYYLQMVHNGAVTLYHDNASKLATTSTGIDITGGFTATDGCTITTADNDPQLILKSTDADASSGPILQLFRDSASPADSDVLGQVKYVGRNDAAEEIVYGKIDVVLNDASDGTEDAEMRFLVATAGDNPNALKLGSTETVFNDSSKDINFRVESDSSTHALFVNAGAERINMFSSAAPAQDCQLFVNDVVLIGGVNAVTGGFPTSGLGIITTQGSYCATFYDDNNLSTPRFTFHRNGDLAVSGSLSKGSGSFRIDHPLPAKSSTHDLVHSFIEGPQADLIYRGSVDLVAGSATVNIDTASGMTDGTFVLLCGDVQCFTSNEDGFTAVKGSVSGNTLTITAEADTCTDTISWMVVGERKDQHMIDTTWTDDNGKVIVEPLKGSQEVSEEE